MANTPYENYVLANEVEDQFNSHLDLQQFCTVDTSLEGTAGMKKIIHRYKATDGTEKLAQGEGNTRTIGVDFAEEEYEIELAQNRFEYYDEEAMKDPMVVPVGMRHAGTDMYNTVNGDVYGEFEKATQVAVVTNFDFDAFVDAQSMMPTENLEDINTFAFVHPSDVAELRKKLKDTLQYVEAFARSGYVGTVAGTNIYTKQDATPGTIALATKEAVTMFIKKGTEVEQITDGNRSESAANVRKNTVFTRKYYTVALTDETQAVKIVKGTATASSDTSASSSKTYYAKSGMGYVAVIPASGDSPSTKGWYEIEVA